MKKKSIISLLICCMTLGMVNTSCQDMLTPDSERHAYDVAQDTLYSYWGVLKSLQNIAERYVILNECRGDLVDGTSYVSDTIAAIINFGKNGYEDKYKDGACAYLKVSDYYHVINSCNAYIDRCDTALMISTGQQKRYMLQECAQVHAIRAWVYMQLVYAYGKVPFYKHPLLTTDDINNFIGDPNHAMVDARSLADSLGQDLETIYAKLDPEDMFPQYNNYGNIDPKNSSYVCHSMRTMFPLDVVIGDLYLLQGDDNACAKAASYYYKFLNSKFCGPLEVDEYISLGDVVANLDDPQYCFIGTPFNETGHSLSNGRYRGEAITCIPSNKGRLDGMVFTDLNRLFGFDATLSANGSGDESNSSVDLNYLINGYRRELIPSKGYEALCDSQKYECYIGSKGDEAYNELVVLPGVGDARRSWIYNSRLTVRDNKYYMPRSEQYTLPMGENTMYGKLISKQNPHSMFSTVYPTIYRKSTIWLRFAEAINRAGFPSYAFAILKNGLVSNHNQWFPTYISEDDYKDSWFSYSDLEYGIFDYDVKDYFLGYAEQTSDSTGILLGWKDQITSIDSLITLVQDYYQKQADEINATLEEGETPVEPKEFNYDQVFVNVQSFQNYPSRSCLKALWYLDRNEVKKAANTEYLNFNNRPYLRGYTGSLKPYYKTNIYDSNGFAQADTYVMPNSFTGSDYVTIGVHQRGCGILRTDDPERWSSYNYVDLVTKKIKENHNVTVTKDQIYDGSIQDWVKEAVEDLIIDEDALELAFEGCRFSDLARVAIRRNNPDFLASRVAMRSGTWNSQLHNILMNPNNWYLPFPSDK